MKICLNLENREEDDEENYTTLFSKPALRKDKKFIKLPKEIKSDFEYNTCIWQPHCNYVSQVEDNKSFLQCKI